MGCNYGDKAKNDHVDKMEGVWQKWINNKNIQHFYKNSDGTVNHKRAQERLKDFAEYKLNLPWDVDYILNEGQIRRVNTEIDSYAKGLRGKWSNILGIVPEGISKQDPISRKFYLSLNDILNAERVNVGKRESAIADVTNHMIQAYIKAGQQGKYYKLGIEAVNDLRKLRRKAQLATDRDVRVEFEKRIEDFINGDKGEFIKQFQMLAEIPKDNFKKMLSERDNQYYENADGKKVFYSPHIIRAAEASRKYLKEMSYVTERGLEQLKKVVDLKYGRFDRTHADSIKEEINNAKKIIADGRKEEGYWPGLFMQNLVDIKTSMDTVMPTKSLPGLKKQMTQLQTVLQNLATVPDSAKKENPLLNTVWEKDPLFVLGQYGKDVVGFNKLVFSQEAYLKAMRDIPKTNSTKFLKGMQKFISEEYAVFTEGMSTRPDWVNNMVYYVNAFQTARTMGFNVTGAIKNADSAVHYFSAMGPNNVRRAMRDYRHNDKLREIVDEMEAEAGYKFADPASELFSEGLISRAEFEKANIEFNPITGKIEYNGSPIRDSASKAMNWSIGKLLVLHRLTENNQRRWMFNTAFITKYQQLLNNSHFTEKKAKMFAKNYALNMVNGFAYEYAPHAKAKWVRGDGIVMDEVTNKAGETDYIVRRPAKGQANWAGVKGGIKEITFHLMHYPLSLAETHLNAFRGMGKSLKSKQWDSDELLYAVRYGAVFSLIQAGSILANTDLNNIFENETISRLDRIENDLMTAEPELRELFTPDWRNIPDQPDIIMAPDKDRVKKTYGLLSQASGPTLGHIKYGLIAAGVLDIDSNAYMEMMFGNVDYSKDTEEVAQYTAYQYSTEWGKLRNKNWPAIRDGRGMDVIRHWLSFYPADWTKKYHDMIFGTSGLNVKGKGKKKKGDLGYTPELIPEQNQAAVSAIDRIFG